jgi:hypothetical protein
MSSKGKYFSQTLTIVSQQKVSKKKVVMTSYYPFVTELPERDDEYSVMEVWECCHCSKDYSEDCGCNAGFEKREIRIRDGY